MAAWTIIDEQTPRILEMGDDGAVDVTAFGWERKPEGLCRTDVCIPVSDGPVTLATFARLTGRPIVTDPAHRVAALGASATDRSVALASGLAPDFELPGIDGQTYRLSDYRGRKVVLYAYASW